MAGPCPWKPECLWGSRCGGYGGCLSQPRWLAYDPRGPRVYPGPSSTPLFPEEVLFSHGKSANPVGSIFQSYPDPDSSLPPPLSLLWFAAQVPSLDLCRSLLTGLPAPTLFSFCNLLCPCFAQNNLASWDLHGMTATFRIT